MIPRRALLGQRGRQGVQRSIPAPVGGWNARDSLDAMPKEDAVLMRNFVPGQGSAVLRKGFTPFVSSGMGTTGVETLASFEDGANEKFLAGANGNVYDITSGAASSLASGFSENEWSTVNFDGKMGWVNGTDAPQTYDGSTMGALTVSGSGLTVTDLIYVSAYRSRTWFAEKDSQDVWYSAIDALGGALTKFPLSRVGNFGGHLKAIGTWAQGGVDDTWGGGGQLTDVIVFFMSSGEVIVYNGDPASTFALVGVYRTGAPIGRRCLVKIGADLIVITRDGFISMSSLMREGRLGDTAQFSDKIRNAVLTAAQNSSALAGWQPIFYPKRKWAIVNVPQSATHFEQYVVNLNSRKRPWFRMTGLNAIAWGSYDGRIFFGTTVGTVMEADTGLTDNTVAIDGDIRQAPQHFGASLNVVSAVKPLLAGSGSLAFSIAVEEDFKVKGLTGDDITLNADFVPWEAFTENWEDLTDNWEDSASPAITGRWITRSARGSRFSIHLRAMISETLEWSGSDILFERGSGL